MKRKLNILGDGPVHPPYQKAFDTIVETYGEELWDAIPSDEKDQVFKWVAEHIYQAERGFHSVTPELEQGMVRRQMDEWEQDQF